MVARGPVTVLTGVDVVTIERGPDRHDLGCGNSQAWGEFVPFLDFPPELRKVVYTTNAIESLNAQFRRGVRHRGHFPNEQSAMKVLYLIATRRRPNR